MHVIYYRPCNKRPPQSCHQLCRLRRCKLQALDLLVLDAQGLMPAVRSSQGQVSEHRRHDTAGRVAHIARAEQRGMVRRCWNHQRAPACRQRKKCREIHTNPLLYYAGEQTT